MDLKRIVCTVMVFPALVAAAYAAPVLIEHEDVIEGATVVTLQVAPGARSGTASVRACPTCEQVRLRVTPQTVIVDGDVTTHVSGPVDFTGRIVDVFYLPAEREVTRLRPWQ